MRPTEDHNHEEHESMDLDALVDRFVNLHRGWEKINPPRLLALPNQAYKDVAPNALPAPESQYVLAVHRQNGEILSIPTRMSRSGALNTQLLQVHTTEELRSFLNWQQSVEATQRQPSASRRLELISSGTVTALVRFLGRGFLEGDGGS